MTTTQDTERAEGKIAMGKERMLAKYPFHTAVLNKMPVVARPSVETMAVLATGGEVLLLHNPEFVLKTPLPQLVGVLLHETHHVIFNHLSMSHKEYPHHPALVIAQEVTVNEFITEPLPEGVVLLKNYPMLPPRESTKERYKKLAKIIPQAKVVITLDDHTVWEIEATGGVGDTEETVQKILEEVVEQMKSGNIPQEIEEVLRQRGIGTDDDIESVTTGTGKANWRTLLRRYVGQILEVRPVYTRPPRRFPDMVGIIPGKSRQMGKPKVMAVIDTSGSITPTLLSQVNGELRGLAKHYTVTVVECDEKIQRVYPYKHLTTVWGRGGTDLRPPLEKKFLAKHRPDLVLYFTDGYGLAPEKAPGVPVMWAILPGGESPCAWGKHIQLD